MLTKNLNSYLILFLIQFLLAGCANELRTELRDPQSNLSPDVRYGELFHQVQVAKIFSDSKTFVDSTPKRLTDDIMRDYFAARDQENFDIKSFVVDNFELPPSIASDFSSDPSRSPAEHMNVLWDVLTRTPDKSTNGTLIPMPHPYVVPGGRFREIYYWDSYFTMLGLRESGRVDLIENMVDNFSYLIDTMGFIPNGNRTYYQGRSQPPFYALMVELLAEKKGKGVLRKYKPQLLKEYSFWMDGASRLTKNTPTHRRAVLMPNGAVLNRYWDDLSTPRPESYIEDIELVEHSSTDKNELYRHIRAAAESGWDFSGRWFRDGRDMATIHTTEIIPVDLNALLYRLEIVIAKAYEESSQLKEAKRYRNLAEARREALNLYCWDQQIAFYRDFDFVIGQQTPHLSLAAVYPLYIGIADAKQAKGVANKIAADFVQAGGVTTTLAVTGQQWDAPNGWAPLEWMTIKGLQNYGHTELAVQIRKKWISLNVGVYKRTGKMVEKYNVYDMTLEAGGGEYPVQDGFGWTNGVLLKLLNDEAHQEAAVSDSVTCIACIH